MVEGKEGKEIEEIERNEKLLFLKLILKVYF